jgi:predicted RNA-binding protein YlxR (DUF448 family)
MPKNFHIPIRMCLSCRQRDSQSRLLRLQCNSGELNKYIGTGRSFYLCEDCLGTEKKILKVLMRQCKSPDKDKFMNKLKEIIIDGR